MMAALEAGKPVQLDKVDIFCDGTAVRKVGDLTYQVCKDVIDEWMTVSNDEVSAAVQFLWEQLRCIPEPSGAMGIAAVFPAAARNWQTSACTVVCGANAELEPLATISRRAAVGAARRRYLRIGIPEISGAMHRLLEALPDTVSIACGLPIRQKHTPKRLTRLSASTWTRCNSTY